MVIGSKGANTAGQGCCLRFPQRDRKATQGFFSVSVSKLEMEFYHVFAISSSSLIGQANASCWMGGMWLTRLYMVPRSARCQEGRQPGLCPSTRADTCGQVRVNACMQQPGFDKINKKMLQKQETLKDGALHPHPAVVVIVVSEPGPGDRTLKSIYFHNTIAVHYWNFISLTR